MALPEHEQAEESRRRILKTESAALALLLLIRRRTVPPRANLQAIANLERELYPTIVGIRAAARGEAFEHVTKYFGRGFERSGIPGRIEDIRRAKLYTGNAGQLGRDVIADGGPLIRQIDNRLVTIAITENSNAYNLEHRQAVLDRADQLGLIEIWDATLDQATCEVCMGLDGTEAVDGQFPGGLSPGGVHARCRCTSHFVRRHLRWLN